MKFKKKNNFIANKEMIRDVYVNTASNEMIFQLRIINEQFHGNESTSLDKFDNKNLHAMRRFNDIMS